MFARFNFRVTPLSLSVLAAATVLYVAGLHYLMPDSAPRFWVWVTEKLGFQGTLFLLVADRALEMLLFVLFPFRSHIRERPALFWATLGVSFCATALPWLFWGMSQAVFIGIVIPHVFAAGIYWLFLWHDTPAPVPVSVGSA